MARYCSAQESARTRWSPSYRETILVNVVQGTKSMSCANSVLPVYMAVSAEKSARLCPQPIQVDTAHFWPETRAIRGFQSFAPSVNRTAVFLLWLSLGLAELEALGEDWYPALRYTSEMPLVSLREYPSGGGENWRMVDCQM